MASRYYIIDSSTYSSIENNLEYPPAWNVDQSQCIIEVAVGYDPPSWFIKFRSSNECQDYINHPDRIDEWYQPNISELP